MNVPNFLTLKDDALVFNLDGELVYYVPEEYFSNETAVIIGSHVSMIGICDYCIISPDGKVGEVKPFRFPTVFLCKPSTIEKAKSIKIGKSHVEKNYRILHFVKGDEVVSQTRVPQIIDNVEDFYRLMVISGRIPTTISYDQIQDYFTENMTLNGSGYHLNMQLFGILVAELCRDPNDISKLFCETQMRDMHGYRPASIKVGPNYISPYVAITSENFDESLQASILMADDDEVKYSPLERVVTR